MWNPFKKKKQEIAREPVWVPVPRSGVIKCIADDPDVETTTGYKDSNGKFFDNKEDALKSNAYIKKQEDIDKLSAVICKTLNYHEVEDDYSYAAHPRVLNNKYQARRLAEELHDNPSLLRDYLNENYG